MKAELVRVEPIALMPTPSGCAVFLGDGQKVIVFYIEPSIGASINMVLAGQSPPRPLTHDLFNQVLEVFGARLERVVILAVEEDVYFARMILQAKNEIMERKIVELDARPSDCIALAVRQEAPIFVVKKVWDELKNMSDVLDELNQGK